MSRTDFVPQLCSDPKTSAELGKRKIDGGKRKKNTERAIPAPLGVNTLKGTLSDENKTFDNKKKKKAFSEQL